MSSAKPFWEYERHADDWYVEPAWSVEELARVERPFTGVVLDPCCGGGNIPRTLRQMGVDAIGVDLRDRGYTHGAVAPYIESIPFVAPDSVISNPPYREARAFVETSLTHTTDRVCCLLRLAFLETPARAAWFRESGLSRVWVSSRRISMPPGDSGAEAKGGKVAFAWFVWEHGWNGVPVLGWF